VERLHLRLHEAVGVSGGREGGRGVDLDEPGLEALVHNDVVAVQLEAVAVVDHGALARLQRVHHDGADLRKEALRGGVA